MGRRNWCSIRWDQKTGELSFDIRVEREKGVGETVGYACFPLVLPWVLPDHLIHLPFAVISSRHLHPAGGVEIGRALESSALIVHFFFHAPRLYMPPLPLPLLDLCGFALLLTEAFYVLRLNQKYRAPFPYLYPLFTSAHL
jgi:hypothetical protein